MPKISASQVVVNLKKSLEAVNDGLFDEACADAVTALVNGEIEPGDFRAEINAALEGEQKPRILALEGRMVASAAERFPELVEAAATPHLNWIVAGKNPQICIDAEPLRLAWADSESAQAELRTHKVPLQPLR